jgi:hypothetical protein
MYCRGDAVRLAGGVDQADAGAAGGGVEHPIERERDEVAVLQGDHRPAAAFEQVLRRAEAERTRVLQVEGDRVRAAQLVPNLLDDQGGVDAERREALLQAGLDDAGQVDLGQAQVAVLVAFDGAGRGQVVGRQTLGKPFGQDGGAVAAATCPIPSARWPAWRPMARIRYQRRVVRASVIRFLTICTPRWRAV